MYRVYSDELYHYGIMGMHWGVRRYQNSDGSLTEAGQARYNAQVDRLKRKTEIAQQKANLKQAKNNISEQNKRAKQIEKSDKQFAKQQKAEAKRQNEDIKRREKIAKETEKRRKEEQRYNDKRTKKQQKYEKEKRKLDNKKLRQERRALREARKLKNLSKATQTPVSSFKHDANVFAMIDNGAQYINKLSNSAAGIGKNAASLKVSLASLLGAGDPKYMNANDIGWMLKAEKNYLAALRKHDREGVEKWEKNLEDYAYLLAKRSQRAAEQYPKD